MFRFPIRHRSRRGLWPVLSRVFYLAPQKQYMLIVGSAIGMATLVFSGLLLFRQADHTDLMTRGKWLMRQGKAAKAIQSFEQLVRQYNDSYEGHLELGKAYMVIEEDEKAAKEFRMASRLRAGNLRDSGAHVALSRMMIAQGKYVDAERQLLQAYKADPKNRRDPELLMALVDLYSDWGDHYLEQSPPKYEQAFIKYSRGLRFVKSDAQQKPLEEKLVESVSFLSDQYENDKEYDKAIAVLKRAAQFKYDPDLLVKIAALYENKGDLDKAIAWNREAYKMAPQIISLKLSSLLIRKGRELNEAHQPQKAETFFQEARKVNETVRLPLDTLYPIKASRVEVAYQINPSALTMTPTVNFTLANGGSHPLNRLRVRAEFLGKGDRKLSEAEELVASSTRPLPPSTTEKGGRTVRLEANGSISLSDLPGDKLKIRISITYEDTMDAKWHEIKNAELTINEATASR